MPSQSLTTAFLQDKTFSTWLLVAVPNDAGGLRLRSSADWKLSEEPSASSSCPAVGCSGTATWRAKDAWAAKGFALALLADGLALGESKSTATLEGSAKPVWPRVGPEKQNLSEERKGQHVYCIKH